MNEEDRLSPLGAEMIAGLAAFRDALASDEPIGARFTVRTVSLDIPSRSYSADDVRRVRLGFGASQAVFAEFLGVSVKALRSWEQGTRPVPRIACRFLDEIVASPELWARRLRPPARPTTS